MSIKLVEKSLSKNLDEIHLVKTILKYIKCNNCKRHCIETKDIYNKCHCEYCLDCKKIIIQINLDDEFICYCERCDDCEKLKDDCDCYCKGLCGTPNDCCCDDYCDECECNIKKGHCHCCFECEELEENCECVRCEECGDFKYDCIC